MLKTLLIRNFAIVDSLELEFSGGFTAITGETGAGKSILVDALGLLIGNRADSGAVRAGADKAELTAEFELTAGNPALAWLREADLDEGEDCLLRRMISAGGRSRAWINGTPVTLQQLQQLGDLLVEIHGQNEHIRLVNSDEQFRLLDGSGGHDRELASVESAFTDWQALHAERESLLAESPLTEGDLDLLQYQIREIEQCVIPAEAFLELEREHQRLAKGGQIVSALEFARSSLDAEGSGIGESIHAVLGQLREHTELNPDIAEAESMLQEALINCEEARGSVLNALSRIDLSPQRLSEVEEQLNTLHDLARKHRTEPEQLEAVLERLQARYERSGSVDRRLNLINAELETAEGIYRKSAHQLSKVRQKRGQKLSRAVSILMHELGMEDGQFVIEVQHSEDAAPSGRGGDKLRLLVSANPGMPPAPLRKVASGGELSRISLAIKVASKADQSAVTQIFDEVDAGIGGETANSVGQLLRSLSSGGQSLCVTHLAQVAVCANQQFQVMKSAEEETTRVSTSLLKEQERVDEIARMLGGRLSDQSRAHASELLSRAGTRH